MNEKLDKIFKAYDVRGIYPEEFNEESAYAIAGATARFLGAKRLVVAMDSRESSESLKNSVSEAVLGEGVDVIYIGLATTPMFYFAVASELADGGIMITASHNPPQYNGLKIVGKNAIPVGENSGLLEIKNLCKVEVKAEQKQRGNLTEKDHIENYIDFLSQGVSGLNIKAAVDCASGVAGLIISKLAKKIGLDLVLLCADIKAKPAHEGNPLKDENVVDLVARIKGESVDIGIAFDTDADRVFFFDSEGERVPSAIIASLIAEEYLKSGNGNVFVGSVNISKIFRETVESAGGVYIKNRVGHVFMKQAMKEKNAVFGAELSGHFYFKKFFNADSGMFAMMEVLKIMKKTGKSIKELAKKYQKYFSSGEINYEVKDKKEAMEKIKDVFKDGRASFEDGITIEYPDFWLNIRPSNTEPLLRVNIEANSKELLEEKIDQIRHILE